MTALQYIPFLLVSFLVLTFATEIDVEPILPSITGGVNAVNGEYPSLVSIQTPLHSHCVGVIVDPRHVLTSAQCVINNQGQRINPFFVRVISGDLNIMVPSYRRFSTNVTHTYTHPDFAMLTRANDIAVIRVGTPFPLPHNTIDVAIRNLRAFPDGTNCRMAGWGSPTITGVRNPLQQSIAAPIINRANCNAANVHQGGVLETMICAGSIPAVNPPVGPCTGNLGAGLFCNNQLTGILSFGLGCGAANTPGVYTNVQSYQAWINQQFTRMDLTFPN